MTVSPAEIASAEFDAHTGPDGLLLRFALGRVRYFWNRQVLGLLGAVVVGIGISAILGLIVAALIVAGDAFDCLALRHLSQKMRNGAINANLHRLAAVSGALQVSALMLALELCLRSANVPEVSFFVVAFLVGVAIDIGIARPYFRLGADAKFAVISIAMAFMVIDGSVHPHETPKSVFLFLASAGILVLTTIMFIRQVERGFAKHQTVERSMFNRNAELRRGKDEAIASGKMDQWLALAAQHANDAIVFLDADDRYTWVNEAFTRITGFAFDDAVGQRPYDLLNAPETAPETIEKLRDSRQNKTPLRIEIFNRGKSGAGYWVDTSIIPIHDAEGQFVAYLAIEREITQAKQREAELAQARENAEAAAQMKSRFLANMSHEIRTPLNGVIGISELLIETPMNTLQREYVETVLESGRSLLRLINDILDLSKLQSGTSALDNKAFDVLATIQNVLRLLTHEARKKGLDLLFQPPEDLAGDGLFVHGDQGKLRQILINLVGNALKFTAIGSVAVELARTADGLEFRVRDTGIGIDPARMASIFDSFTQEDDSISRRFGGTGLGLTISAMLAEQMGGRISVTSQRGAGSCFIFAAPFAAALTALPVATVAAPTQTAGLRLLVAEDNRTNMLILRKVLTGQVADLFEVEDGLSAVQAWEDLAPDLILMDVSMPVMDGLTAVREIRLKERQLGRPRCPILALTASDQLEDRQACTEAGFDDFLVKPFRREVLFRTISDHCRKAKLEQSAKTA